MIRTLGHWGFALALVGLVTLVGCKSSESAKTGIFFNNYSDLRQSPNSGGWYTYFSERDPISGYNKFVIEPLIIQFTPQQPKPVSMQDVDRAEQAYRESLAAALTRGGRFQQASAPGDRVLVLRGAVTDLYQRDPKGAQVGRATMELEGIDAVTRKRVFAVIDPMLGNPESGSGERTSPRDVFTQFANQLRTQIDRASSTSQK